ncbi:acyl-CoA desaturase [Vampirovibrio sp.]|uniref:acyl-CoA desaturase n=1 Tax=Vampirovibrio sp. TaxID=2717857 RepID=UPI003593E0EE
MSTNPNIVNTHSAIHSNNPEPIYANQSEWSRWIPFAFLHVGGLAAFWCGWSPTAVLIAVALYWVRMFAITAFYHRYFSHRSFQTGRVQQFIFAVWAMTSVQRGPLWWASHHRRHHRLADKPGDPHSPVTETLLQSHIGWMTVPENLETDYTVIKDLTRFPELVFLNKFDWVVPACYAMALYALGYTLEQIAPSLGTNGFQILIWGFFISTVVLFHGTCTINSLAHLFGSRRYATADDSRNNLWLALITLGEGWHNNHHKFQNTVRQGFYWWEIDITYYVLRLMAGLGIIHNLNPVPVEAYQTAPTSAHPSDTNAGAGR